MKVIKFLLIFPFFYAAFSFALNENLALENSFEECNTSFESEKVNELIYIQQAKVAELSQDPNSLGKYLLKISGSDKTLVYFSDKPNREAGTLTLSQFVKAWQNNGMLKENPPNVVISYVNFKPSSESGVGADVLTLSNPQYDFSSDSVTFNATPLHEFDIMTGKFENVVMVFDGLTQEENLL